MSNGARIYQFPRATPAQLEAEWRDFVEEATRGEVITPDATRPRAITPGADANMLTTTATVAKRGGRSDDTP